MKHLHSFDELRQINRKIVYALGTFDGVHVVINGSLVMQ